jgi:hypothetical protein
MTASASGYGQGVYGGGAYGLGSNWGLGTRSDYSCLLADFSYPVALLDRAATVVLRDSLTK